MNLNERTLIVIAIELGMIIGLLINILMKMN